MTGKDRKTLDKVQLTPTPHELYTQLINAKGWPYKTEDPEEQFYYQTRDKALPALLYVGELRISEAIRIKLGQFEDLPEALVVHNVLVSKCKQGKPRYRELKLPKTGERACFTTLVQNYLTLMRAMNRKAEDRLFPWSLEVKRFKQGIYKWKDGKKETQLYSVHTVGTHRAWQIVNALLPQITEHWLRVFGEKWLYKQYGKDVIAVAKVVKVDPRTAIKYLMAGEEEYPIV